MPQLPDDISPSTLVTVYEAANDARRELYVGLTVHFVGQVELTMREAPELRHWLADEPIRVRGVEYGVPMRDARDFARRYAQSRANSGWSVLLPAAARSTRPA